MKKYLFLGLALFLSTNFLFQNVPLVTAAAEGESCNNAFSGVKCDPGLFCEQADTFFQLPGTCKKAPDKPPDAHCACQHPGVAESAQNGFTCPEVPGKVLFCNGQSLACNPSQDAPQGGMPHDQIKDGTDPAVINPAQSVFGVACGAKKDGDAICRCVGPQQANPQPGAPPGQLPPASGAAPVGPDGNANSFVGQNQIECVKLPPGRNASDPNIWNDPALWTPPPDQKAGATCGAERDQCNNTPGQISDNTKVKNFTGFLVEGTFADPNPVGAAVGLVTNSGYNIYGVTCRQPAGHCECKHPGHAGTRINGFTCTQFGNKDSDYCSWSYEACVTKPGNRLKSSSNRIFNGADLGDIDCVRMPPSPPPPPPCAAALDELGRCNSFNSSLGPLSTDAGKFIASIFGMLLSVSGGLALLLIIRAGYIIMTSSGNPEKIKEGREQLVAAIVGLLFIIFSFVILQVIGVDLLHLPGFTA